MNEKMKILVAYDGSVCADNAINDLPQAGLPREAEALIVNVSERWLPSPIFSNPIGERSGSLESTAVQAVRAKEEPETHEIETESPLLGKAFKKLKSIFPEWHVETFFLRGSPSYQIVSKAIDWKADLIVVGSQGDARKKIYLLGSVSQKIANEAACSVRVVRGNSWKRGAPARILIGLDGTRAARLAVEEVARRMWIPGSEARIVTAKDLPEDKPQTNAQTTKTDEWIENFQTEAENRLKYSALAVSRLTEAGDPKQIIVRAADEWGADSIFIGSCDTGFFYENLLLGSVATAIVARAHCTVEVVRQRM